MHSRAATKSTEPSPDSFPGDADTGGSLPDARLRRVTEYIDANLPGTLSLDELSALAHMSRFHFARLFKKSTGVPPHRFVVRRRIDRAQELVETRTLSISAIAASVGFHSLSHFSKTFHRLTGCAPTVYRGGARASEAAAPPPEAS